MIAYDLVYLWAKFCGKVLHMYILIIIIIFKAKDCVIFRRKCYAKKAGSQRKIQKLQKKNQKSNNPVQQWCNEKKALEYTMGTKNN